MVTSPQSAKIKTKMEKYMYNFEDLSRLNEKRFLILIECSGRQWDRK